MFSEALVTPPGLFGLVEPLVYRSSTITPENFSFIQHLSLRTIVHVSPEVIQRALSDFFEENGIELIPLGLKTWRPTGPLGQISEELVKDALELVLDRKRHPVLIMCTSGVHQTGTVVACLRRMQQLSFTSTLDEFRNFAFRTKTRYVNENFIEFFDPDLINLPAELPQWFIAQRASLEADAEAFSEQKAEDASKTFVKDRAQAVPSASRKLPAFKRHYFNDNTGPLMEKFYADVNDSESDASYLTPGNNG